MAKISFPQELLEQFPEMKARWENWVPISSEIKTIFVETHTRRLKGKNAVGEDENLGPEMKRGAVFSVVKNRVYYGQDKYPYAVYYAAWRDRQRKLSKKGKARVSDAKSERGRLHAVNAKGSTNRKMPTMLYFGGKLKSQLFNLAYYWTMFEDRHGGSRVD